MRPYPINNITCHSEHIDATIIVRTVEKKVKRWRKKKIDADWFYVIFVRIDKSLIFILTKTPF